MVGITTPEKGARKKGISARFRRITIIRGENTYLSEFLAFIYNKVYQNFSKAARRAP